MRCVWCMDMDHMVSDGATNMMTLNNKKFKATIFESCGIGLDLFFFFKCYLFFFLFYVFILDIYIHNF